MKFGQHLLQNIAPEYGPDPYLNYAHLDGIIRALSGKALSSADQESRQISLSMPAPTNTKGVVLDPTTITEEAFFSCMDANLNKVEAFTLRKVTELRNALKNLEAKLQAMAPGDDEETDRINRGADEVAKAFLTLEKYVNINFMGFHKILKKHDKYCPSNPCKTFYVNRMHSQAWVRGDYSDVVVRLSTVYAALRNDQIVEETADASQAFLRSTTKYWIKTEDISKVKYTILKNLPVFLQKTSTGESDSQLTNSVYLDNDQLELYHGRLEKSPGSIALRLRWYGTGDPSLVFVERKTHRDKWIGEVSVKERFMIKEKEVQQIMTNTYPIKTKKDQMMKDGSSLDEAEDWESLVREVTQAISVKQLRPTMRTQYMRTAFQIPFDATVRVSLDTNLCMISERGYDLKNMTVWHRDPSATIAHNEITRFPHAVLEVKLEMKEEDAVPPKWVTDLQNSGLLYEVHKFSKFIHGCAVMMPEDVRAVPYWVDDASVRASIIASGGGRILVRSDMTEKEKKSVKHPGSGPGANQVYDHLLPFGDIEENKTNTAIGRTAASKTASVGEITKRGKQPPTSVEMDSIQDNVADPYDDDGCEDTICSWIFPFCSPANNVSFVAPTSVQKIEPKVFFANERTFLHWLHAGITLYTISSAMLAFSSQEGGQWAEWYAMILMPISLCFCIYALHVFLWRADRIKSRIPGRWDDPRGPYILGGFLVLVLVLNLSLKMLEIWSYELHQEL